MTRATLQTLIFTMVLLAGGLALSRDVGHASGAPFVVAGLPVQVVVAHRGSSVDRPENTVASARRAIEVGATHVEVDIRTTRDGQLVLMHDDHVARMTDGRGKINDLTLAEIQKLNVKCPSEHATDREWRQVPMLREVLAVCREKIGVLLDLKEQGEVYDRHVAQQIREFGEPRRVIVGVRSVEQARAFHKLLPESRQVGLIAKPDEIEAYAAAGVEIIRLWPKWLEASAESPANTSKPAEGTKPTKDSVKATNGGLPGQKLVDRVRKAGTLLHLNGTTGTLKDIEPLLAYRPDSLSSDDPRQLIATLKEIAARRTSE